MRLRIKKNYDVLYYITIKNFCPSKKITSEQKVSYPHTGGEIEFRYVK